MEEKLYFYMNEDAVPYSDEELRSMVNMEEFKKETLELAKKMGFEIDDGDEGSNEDGDGVSEFFKVEQEKKEIRYLNVCLDKKLHDEFEEFCKKMGMSKTGACERALRMFMDKVNSAMEV